MSCYSTEALAEMVDAERDGFSVGAGRGAVHFSTCARCRSELASMRALVGDLGRAPVAETINLAPLVLRRAALPPRRRAAAFAYAAVASLALGTVGALEVDRLSTHTAPAVAELASTAPGMQARGAKEGADTWVAMHLFRTGSDGPGSKAAPLTVGGALSSGDGLLVAYDNGGPRPYRYLLAYAVDARRDVHVLYPAATDENAHSIAIEPGVGRELGDEIRFHLPAGPLEVVGLFSEAPISVAEVERAVRDRGAFSPGLGVGRHAVPLVVSDGLR